MTHSLHRYGSTQSLKDDYVLLQLTAIGINNKGAAPKQKRALEILLKHNPANWGNLNWGNRFRDGYKRVSEQYNADASDIQEVHGVFRTKSEFENCLRELKNADLGMSIVVSGLLDDIFDSLQNIGLKPHTIQYSLGKFGKLKQLPPDKVLAITTMCGHHCVSPALVMKLAHDAARKRISTEEAARTLAKQCLCGIFNPSRAERLLEELMALDEQ